jgi:hypothetical protein
MSDVVDDIDALIATELDEHGVPLDDYHADRYPKCELCQGHWHGLPKASGCPGGHASDLEIEDWRAKAHKDFESKSLDQYVCQIDGVLYRLELHGSLSDEWLHATILPLPDEVESYAGAYSFNEAAARLMVHAMARAGFVDADGSAAVDSVND